MAGVLSLPGGEHFTRGSLLNPLVQRLKLYRFAVVELLGGESIEPMAWGLPLLQCRRARGPWAKVLSRCAPFSTLGQAPLISPSLSVLRAVRLRQPDRPLILCRAAFSSLSGGGLRKLVRPCHPLSGLLAAGDAFVPLRWISTREVPEQTLFPCDYLHPLHLLRMLRQRDNPGSSLFFREDGLVQEQWPLFQAIRQKNYPWLRDHLKGHDRRFERLLEGSGGRCYVFSQSRERLDWFRRDCLRLMARRVHCLPFPASPVPGDPQPYFVLVHDPSIRMKRLNPSWAGLHLDGHSRKWFYRAVRQARGRMGWWREREAEVSARYSSKDGVYRFFRDNTEWFSYPGGSEGHTDGSFAFCHKVMVVRYLFES